MATPDLNVLHRQGLINSYKVDSAEITTGHLPYIEAQPTVYGVILYGAAHARSDSWRTLSSEDFGDFDDIEKPKFSGTSISELMDSANLKPKEEDKPKT
jgi:hypothetical protein